MKRIGIVSVVHRWLQGSALALVFAVSLAQAGPVDITVMTRNLYLGADLAPVIGAIIANDPATPAGDQAVASQVAATWLTVEQSKPVERMQRVANEILVNRPHVVGLQEAVLWQTRTPAAQFGGVGPLAPAYDFFGELQSALGGTYTLVTSLTGPPVPAIGFDPVLMQVKR